ncbi:MAG: hypothetical protein WCO81_07645 [Cyanobacteriota bacterium ELA615]|jgi:hypothetical protein
MNKFTVWITAVVILFTLAQIYQWVTSFLLPLPIYVLAGAFLAIASNLPKRIHGDE